MPLTQLSQVESSVHELQGLMHALQVPLVKYLPTMHPGRQVASFNKNPSTHPPHSLIEGPVQVEQAELHFVQI